MIGFGLALVAMNRDPPMPVETAAIRKVEPAPAPAEQQVKPDAVAVAKPAAAKPGAGRRASADPAQPVDDSALELSDPRWARDLGAAAPAANSVAELADQMRGSGDDGGDAGGQDAAGALAPGSSPGDPTPDQPSDAADAPADAPTDAIGQERTAAIPAPARPTSSAVTGKAPTRNGRVNSGVRMRARADNGAAVVTTIADGATVGIVDCRGWCEIVYGGRRGFIAAKFLDTPTASISRASVPRGKAKPASRATSAAAPAKAAPLVEDPRTKTKIEDKHR